MQLLTPCYGAWEHDSLRQYCPSDREEVPGQVSTQLVDASIQLFAACIPLYSGSIQSTAYEQLNIALGRYDAERQAHKLAAVTVNVAYSLYALLKVAVRETTFDAGQLKHEGQSNNLAELLRVSLMRAGLLKRRAIVDDCNRIS